MLNRSLKTLTRITLRNLRVNKFQKFNKYYFVQRYRLNVNSTNYTSNVPNKNENLDNTSRYGTQKNITSNPMRELQEQQSQYTPDKKKNDYTNKQNSSQDSSTFKKVNQDENFNDIYVGDVEFKVPSKNLNEKHQQILNQVTEKDPNILGFKMNKNKNINDSTMSSSSNSSNSNETNYKNKNPNESNSQYHSNTTANIDDPSYDKKFEPHASYKVPPTSGLSPSSQHSDERYSIINDDEHTAGQNLKDTELSGKRESELIQGHKDLDLSTGSFEVNLKKYEKKMASTNSNDSKTVDSLAPSRDEYYLKDNNSEYNQHILSENQNVSGRSSASNTSNKDKDQQDKQTNKSKHDYSSIDNNNENDIDFEDQSFEEDEKYSNRNRQM